MTNNEEMFFMAKEYAALGWHMIVLWGVNEDHSCACGQSTCTDIGKHPATSRGVKDATKDLEELERLLITEPAAEPNELRRRRNIGIVAGVISGITILDIDTGPGKMGMQTWIELTHEHGAPTTLYAKTGSGGRHVFFHYNSALKTSSNTLGKHVDCRNDAGYVAAPPSLHKSGNKYEWNNWGTPPAPLPAHLTQRKETRGRPRKDDPYRRRYTLEQVQVMLEAVPADDRDLWRAVGIILGREFQCSDAAWDVYVAWADKWEGRKGRGHDGIMKQAFYEISQQESERELSMGTIIQKAIEGGWVPTKGESSVEQFVYDHESNKFIYRQSGALWVAASVDVACGKMNENGRLIRASEWIQTHARITTTTSTPAIQGDILKGYDCRDGVLVESPGGAVYNHYRPPTIVPGDASLAGPFIDHVRRLMPREGDADQFFNFFAHLRQKTAEKLRFALDLFGDQGIGKDTAVDFCCPAIGEWNVASIPPSAVDEDFNEFATKTLVRINEAADLQEMSRWAFTERIKVLIAGNPDACEINPKYGHKYTMMMHCAVVITSNHLTGSLHLSVDDRRHDVIQCATLEEMGLADEKVRRDYFTTLREWFGLKDGARHVAAFLQARDLSRFSAALGQRKTAAHREIVQHGMMGDEWLVDILDWLEYPNFVRTDWIIDRAVGRGEQRAEVNGKLTYTLGRQGYDKVDNPKQKEGRWRVNGVLCRIYRRRDYPLPSGFDAGKHLQIPKVLMKD